LVLPAWLGAGAALQNAIDEGHEETLKAMAASWPFFRSRLSMLEMVFAKADLDIANLYDRFLVIPELKPIGNGLRMQLAADQSTLLRLLESDRLLSHDDWAMESISLRNVYTAPLNLLQVELLRRVRDTRPRCRPGANGDHRRCCSGYAQYRVTSANNGEQLC